MGKKACSDILPRFHVTSCLRQDATSCFFGCDILPSLRWDTLPSPGRDILPCTVSPSGCLQTYEKP